MVLADIGIQKDLPGWQVLTQTQPLWSQCPGMGTMDLSKCNRIPLLYIPLKVRSPTQTKCRMVLCRPLIDFRLTRISKHHSRSFPGSLKISTEQPNRDGSLMTLFDDTWIFLESIISCNVLTESVFTYLRKPKITLIALTSPICTYTSSYATLYLSIFDYSLFISLSLILCVTKGP